MEVGGGGGGGGLFMEEAMGSSMNREAGAAAISFQCDSGAMNSSSSTSEMIQMGNYFVMNTNLPTNTTSGGGGGNMLFSSSGNSSNIHPLITHHQPLASPLLLDSVPGLGLGLKHDTGLAVEWSLEEQYKLEQGLEKYLIHNPPPPSSLLLFTFYLFFLFIYMFIVVELE